MKKLRLVLFQECNRACPGCCNHDWELDALPYCEDYTPYNLIMLTGGEPMLRPKTILQAVNDIRRQTDAPIYLYTAMTTGLDAVLPYLDGVTVTLHTAADIPPFHQFDQTAQNLHGKSLRLNVFDEVGALSVSTRWETKDHIEWIKNCPLPEGETLMLYQSRKMEDDQ